MVKDEAKRLVESLEVVNAEDLPHETSVVLWEDISDVIDQIEMLDDDLEEVDQKELHDYDTDEIADEFCSRLNIDYEDLIIPENLDDTIKLQHLGKIFQ